VLLAQAMRDACRRLVGEHDFRNFCKIDAANVDNFVRVILSFDIQPVAGLRWCVS
jgi:tRNA pseudouridine38/39 synthase